MNLTFLRNTKIKATQTPIVAGTKAIGKFITVPSTVTPGRMYDVIEVTIAEGTEIAPGVVASETLVLKTGEMQMFFKAPTVATLQRWSDGGFAKTVTGKKTEPDGYGTDGSPSWMLVLGMI